MPGDRYLIASIGRNEAMASNSRLKKKRWTHQKRADQMLISLNKTCKIIKLTLFFV